MPIEEHEVWQAWEALRTGGKSAGPDGISVADFRRFQVREIEGLLEELRAGRYLHGLYRGVQVRKPTGGRRTIAVANVRDRVVQRVLHDRLAPLIEATALDCSYAYRPERCHLDALERVGAFREDGFRHVIHADIRDCYDEISLRLVELLLGPLGVDDATLQLVLECLSAGYVGAARPPDMQGLPQGAVLSPILCNLVLTEFDRAMQGRHRRLVRFADDFVVLCHSEAGCLRHLARVREALANLGLEPNERKTEITSFDEGFHFLGARLVKSFIVPEKRPPYPCGPGRCVKDRKRIHLDFVF